MSILSGGLRSSVLAAKTRLAQGRDKLRLRHQQGSPGVQVCGAMTDLLDAVVLDLHHSALADMPGDWSQQVALVALAGCGRRDVAPFSDYDLMILHSPEVSAQVVPLASRLMRDIFDTGLTLGHSVRTPTEACRLALSDATICTSLMDSRLLWGQEAVYQRFSERFQQQVRRHARRVMAEVDAARREERLQYGETVYLLEPNIKRSQGGLRELQLLRWLGFASLGVSDPDSMHLLGAITKEEQQQLRRAIDFLLHLRNELHFHSGKANDALDRAEQVRVAAILGYQGDDGLLPVEQFMQEYFRRTQEVTRIVARFVSRHVQRRSVIREMLGVLFSHQVERDYLVGPGTIRPTRRGLVKLHSSLDEVLRLADLANLYDKRIADSACDAIREVVPSLPAEISPEAAAHFMSLLSQPLRLGTLLRLLYDLGVLEKLIPAFKHARCLLQFNEYHKYTVDEHSLRAVEAVCDFFHDRGSLGNVYRRIKQKRLLHLALLVHDLGKGYPEDHSEVGLRIAEETGHRLRLKPGETEILKFLVHKHLLMAHLAFRRDTSDEHLLVKFAVDCGSPEVLEMLFVLTAADLAAVGPGVLNNWKIEVLTDLFHRTMEHLAGESLGGTSGQHRQQLQADVRSLIGDEDTAWFNEQIHALPSAYLSARGPRQIVDDLRQLRQLPRGQVCCQARWVPETRTVEYTIATHDDITPGVFHKLTGALSGCGLQILSAEINTLGHGLVLDRFFVLDPDYADEPPASRLTSVKRLLEHALTDGGTPSFRKIWRKGGDSPAVLSPLPTQVRCDNSTSDRFTILDIFASDRMGLLYTISRTLFELGLNVSVARIGTYLDQVVDVFYVSDQQNRKVENPERLEQIRSRLLDAIAAIDQHQPDGTVGSSM